MTGVTWVRKDVACMRSYIAPTLGFVVICLGLREVWQAEAVGEGIDRCGLRLGLSPVTVPMKGRGV